MYLENQSSVMNATNAWCEWECVNAVFLYLEFQTGICIPLSEPKWSTQLKSERERERDQKGSDKI